jgi:hypothetical protein
MTIDSSIIAYIQDTGEHSVSPEVFSLADPEAVQHKIRLARGNSVALGAAETSWGVTIVNEIDVMSPNPQ